MENYRLITGDANIVIPRLVKEGVEVDMAFCSPNPLFYDLKKENNRKDIVYNVGSENTLGHYLDHLVEAIFAKVYLILKDTGSLWVHMMDTFLWDGSMTQVPERFTLQMVRERKWLLRGKRVWLRGPHEITEGSSEELALCPWDWEPVYWFTKQEGGYTFNRDSAAGKTSVITGAPYVDRLPLQVVKEAIDLTTKPGDTVLDCFVGGGQVGIAALQMGRKFIGIDLSADKVALAQRRLRLVVPSKSN
jgi:DNA modification methylase